jgi:hypothetical protein
MRIRLIPDDVKANLAEAERIVQEARLNTAEAAVVLVFGMQRRIVAEEKLQVGGGGAAAAVAAAAAGGGGAGVVGWCSTLSCVFDCVSVVALARTSAAACADTCAMQLMFALPSRC